MANSKEIEILQKHPEDVFVVHCSYGKTINENHFSPSIHCIYVKNVDSSFSAKFSIEKYASRNGISLTDISDWYDDLEIYVLDDFNEFLKSKSECLFTYWVEQGSELMLDIIKTRFEELNKDNSLKKFHDISGQNRKSLQSLLNNLSGIEFLNQTDLKAFIKEHNNQQLMTGYLAVSEENSCFGRKEYDKIALSVTAKVDFFIKKINQQVTNPTAKKSDNNATIDLQSISLGWLLKRLNIGSWVLLIGICAALFLAGLGINEYFASKAEKSMEREIQDLNKQLQEKEQTHTTEIIQLKDTITILRNGQTDSTTTDKPSKP